MKTIRLGAIAESLPCEYGDDPTDDAPAFDVVKVSNVSGEGQFHGDFEKRRFRDDQIAGLLVKEGELLVVKSSGSKANILSGKTAICGPDRADQIVASNFLMRLRVDDSAAVPRFLWYVLNSGASKAFVKTIVGASTYPNLKWSLYASLPIPLPPLAEQRRIAEVLDRAEALRAKRRAALAQLDSLTQSLFLDLFGDPATNPKGWPVSRVGEVADVQGGLQVTTTRKDLPNEVPYLRVANVYRGFLNLSEIKTIRATDAEIARTKLVKDDLLIVEGHGNPAEIGRGALWDGSINGCIHQNHIIRARFASAKVVPLYASEYLNSSGGRRHLLRAGKTTTGLNTISVSEVRGTPVTLPPIPLQREFARRVTAVEALKTAQRASLAELDALFATLQHRAFRGEL